MPKLYSSEYISKVLIRHGFELVSQKGSHKKYRKEGQPTLTAIVPAERKVVPVGTFNSILRQSGLNKADFE